MKCSKCGTELEENAKFCPKCGMAVSAGQAIQPNNAAPEQTVNPTKNVKFGANKKTETNIQACKLEDRHIKQLSSSFVSKDEKFIGSMGNGYIVNYLVNHSVSRGFAFITDKRVYFKGTCLTGTGKRLTKSNEERTVDLKSITGSGFIYRNPIGLKIAAVILMVLGALEVLLSLLCRLLEHWLFSGSIRPARWYNLYWCLDEITLGVPARLWLWFGVVILGILLFLAYLLLRKTLFRIEYAGGCIAFDVSLYAKAEMDDFQKQLRRAKDLAEETSTYSAVAAPSNQAAAQNSAPASVPDDLRKYAELLKDGLISQEEYDAVKKKTLGL